MKHALIIANTEYTDPSLRELYAPGKDAEDFARVLKSKDLAAFDHVTIMINETAANLREAIDDFFYLKQTDDLLLLYFSGHGIKDEFGSLYLAVKNTKKSHLRSTAIDSNFIRLGMDQCQSIRQVIILDCCNSGAFPEGSKAEIGGSMGTSEAFQGRGVGRIVLTASDSTQFAWEGSKVTGEAPNSIFTEYLIKGIEGEADRDADGKITIDDLYLYTYDQVTRRTTKQTPRKYTFAQQGEIIIRDLTEGQKRIREELKLQEERERKEKEENFLQEIEKKMQDIKEAHETAEANSKRVQEEIERERKLREAAELKIKDLSATSPMVTPQEAKTPRRITNLGMVPKLGIGLASVLLIALAAFVISKGFQPQVPDVVATDAPNGNTNSSDENISGGDIPIPASQFTLEANSALPIDDLAVLTPDNIKNISGITRWGSPKINDIAYSPDGTKIATATAIGIYFYDANDLKVLKIIETNNKVNCVTFSPDGKILFAGLEEEGAQAWNLETEKQLTSFFDSSYVNSSVNRIFYLDKTSRILVMSNYGAIEVFDTDGAYINEIDMPEQSLPNGIAVSPDETSFATISYDTLSLWNLNENGEAANQYSIKDRITNGYRVDFSADGQYLFVATEYGNSPTIWRASDGILLQTLDDIQFGIFSPTENVLIGSTWDYHIKAIEPSNGNIINSFSSGSVIPKYFSFNPSGKKIAFSAGGQVQVFNISTGTVELRSSEYINSVDSYYLSRDGSLLATKDSEGGNILVRNSITGEVAREFKKFTDYYIGNMGFSFDNASLIVFSEQSLWYLDIASGNSRRIIGSLEDPKSPQEIAVSDDGQLVAYYITDQQNGGFSIVIFSVQGEEILKEMSDPVIESYYSPYQLSFSKDNTTLATIANGSVNIWDIETGKVIKQLTTPDGYVPGFSYLSDGGMAYSIDSKIFLANNTGEDTGKSFVSPDPSPDYMTLSPDGKLLVATSFSNGYVHIWDTQSGELITSIRVSHEKYGYGIPRFSSDGKILIVNGIDGTLQFWGVYK